MNLKKLAILLGVAVLCSFTDAKATINIKSTQSVVSGATTPNASSKGTMKDGQSLNESLDSGPLSTTKSSSLANPGSLETPNVKIVQDSQSQGDITLNANLP